MTEKNKILYAILAVLATLTFVGIFQSWSVALTVFNICLISAVLSLGLNLQWGYAGLLNVGVMGFIALGGMTAVLVAMPPVVEAWELAGESVALFVGMTLIAILGLFVVKKIPHKLYRRLSFIGISSVYVLIYYFWFLPVTEIIESVEPAKYGYLGGMGLPIIFSWLLGGIVSALVAWGIGKISLGLRGDYLAIATVGISMIIIFILKNESWLTRGVKNVTGIPQPVPTDLALKGQEWIIQLAQFFNTSTQDAASLINKLGYSIMFLGVVIVLYIFMELMTNSPWGRMMRAIRDNEAAAEAMGKNVKKMHLQTFVLGSAVLGFAGAMLITYMGQFIPSSFEPLRYTFLIWVMVVMGGSGNNAGAVLGAFIVWLIYVEAEPLSQYVINLFIGDMDAAHPVKKHLIMVTPFIRTVVMGSLLLVFLRFYPRGLITGK